MKNFKQLYCSLILFGAGLFIVNYNFAQQIVNQQYGANQQALAQPLPPTPDEAAAQQTEEAPTEDVTQADPAAEGDLSAPTTTQEIPEGEQPAEDVAGATEEQIQTEQPATAAAEEEVSPAEEATEQPAEPAPPAEEEVKEEKETDVTQGITLDLPPGVERVCIEARKIFSVTKETQNGEEPIKEDLEVKGVTEVVKEHRQMLDEDETEDIEDTSLNI